MIMVVLALRLIITLDQWFFVQMKLMSFDSYLILTYSTKSIKEKKIRLTVFNFLNWLTIWYPVII